MQRFAKGNSSNYASTNTTGTAYHLGTESADIAHLFTGHSASRFSEAGACQGSAAELHFTHDFLAAPSISAAEVHDAITKT